MDGLTRLAWAYLTPTYTIMLTLLSLYLGSFVRFNKIFGRSACIYMIWQFILLTFSSVATTSIGLLECVPLEYDDVDSSPDRWMGYRRFGGDASYVCFQGTHLLWGIVAVVVTSICCVLPFTMPFLHHYPRFKPFFDVYSCAYTDSKQWWCAVDLLRRLVLAVLYVFVEDPDNQQAAVLAFCTLLLCAQALAWPFKTWRANAIETLCLLALCLIALLARPDITRARSVTIEVIVFASALFLLFSIVYEQVRVFWLPRQAYDLFPCGRDPLPVVEGGQATSLRFSLLSDQTLPSSIL